MLSIPKHFFSTLLWLFPLSQYFHYLESLRGKLGIVDHGVSRCKKRGAVLGVIDPGHADSHGEENAIVAGMVLGVGMRGDHNTHKCSGFIIGEGEKRSVGLLVKKENACPKRVRLARRTLKYEHAAEFPGNLWIPTGFSSIGNFRSFEKSWNEHELRAAELPGVFVKVTLKEKWRLFFLQHFIVSAYGGDVVHVIFACTTILRRITPLFCLSRVVIVECPQAENAFLIRRSKQFKRVFHVNAARLPLRIIIVWIGPIHAETDAHVATVAMLNPARGIDLTWIGAQLETFSKIAIPEIPGEFFSCVRVARI